MFVFLRLLSVFFLFLLFSVTFLLVAFIRVIQNFHFGHIYFVQVIICLLLLFSEMVRHSCGLRVSWVLSRPTGKVWAAIRVCHPAFWAGWLVPKKDRGRIVRLWLVGCMVWTWMRSHAFVLFDVLFIWRSGGVCLTVRNVGLRCCRKPMLKSWWFR